MICLITELEIVSTKLQRRRVLCIWPIVAISTSFLSFPLSQCPHVHKYYMSFKIKSRIVVHAPPPSPIIIHTLLPVLSNSTLLTCCAAASAQFQFSSVPSHSSPPCTGLLQCSLHSWRIYGINSVINPFTVSDSRTRHDDKEFRIVLPSLLGLLLFSSKSTLYENVTVIR